jgi:hypothetical protein
MNLRACEPLNLKTAVDSKAALKIATKIQSHMSVNEIVMIQIANCGAVGIARIYRVKAECF